MRRKDIPEYKIWKAIKARCYAPCNENMGNYKKFKIEVCKKWKNDFLVFYSDMGTRPSPKHTIDRIDTKGDYSPENCRWVLMAEQAKNRGDFTPVYTYNGESHILKDWAYKLNIPYTTLRNRIALRNLSFEDAIKEDPYNRLIEINGEKKILIEWCKIYNRRYMTVINRINKHKWDRVRAILTPTKKPYNDGE